MGRVEGGMTLNDLISLEEKTGTQTKQKRMGTRERCEAGELDVNLEYQKSKLDPLPYFVQNSKVKRYV